MLRGSRDIDNRSLEQGRHPNSFQAFHVVGIPLVADLSAYDLPLTFLTNKLTANVDSSDSFFLADNARLSVIFQTSFTTLKLTARSSGKSPRHAFDTQTFNAGPEESAEKSTLFTKNPSNAMDLRMKRSNHLSIG